VTVAVEFLCKTDRVEQGAIFRPTGEAVGSNLGALNVRGAYDLVFTPLNFGDDPTDAGRSAAASPVAHVDQVSEAITLLAERFAPATHDGPAAYANFLATSGDDDELARYRQEAFAVVRQFLEAFRATPSQ